MYVVHVDDSVNLLCQVAIVDDLSHEGKEHDINS
jgi:hypothetical protein